MTTLGSTPFSKEEESEITVGTGSLTDEDGGRSGNIFANLHQNCRSAVFDILKLVQLAPTTMPKLLRSLTKLQPPKILIFIMNIN